MKRLIFDAGPIISLTMNNLLWAIEPLKDRFKGNFMITGGVRYELVERPFKTKKFKFEALQVEELIETGVLEIMHSSALHNRAQKIMDLANSAFMTRNRALNIVQLGEAETLAAFSLSGADGVVVDERITRNIIEKPEALADVLSRRLHSKVDAHMRPIKELRDLVGTPIVFRSVELVALMYEFGILDRFKVKVKNVEEELLDSLLWGVKLDGCSVSAREIDQIKSVVMKK